ncbi:phosphatase PAP2 family protein [uncultured Methanobrevibacter sp.]|uniref:phosphatase PAP2 family protein n=1 Tax=uncultured Methanobrevibacter sp. TaxID=253161 RepID=UPI0025F8A175|nr:phosphatase PAP2 family protein [uncultured Methanobrevibacter sp.]
MIKILLLDILIFLEFIREATGGIFNKFFLDASFIANLPEAVFIIAIIYWCFDKKLGEFLLVSMAFTRNLSSMIKNTVAIYRPWILNPNIHPLEEAMEEATGYSFPSGHTGTATILFGGILVKKEKIVTSLKILAITAIIIVGFSRLYVGVHTIWDVVFGFLFSLIVLIIMKKVFDKYEDRPNFDLIILAVGIIFSIILILYSTFKGYPMDYDSSGKLIVEPSKMMLDAYKNVGFSVGTLLSWVIERRYIKFSTDVGLDSKFARIIGGFIGFQLLMCVIAPAMKPHMPQILSRFMTNFLLSIYIILIVPICIKIAEKIREKRENKEIVA